jgi:hypothetical protein
VFSLFVEALSSNSTFDATIASGTLHPNYQANTDDLRNKPLSLTAETSLALGVGRLQ